MRSKTQALSIRTPIPRLIRGLNQIVGRVLLSKAWNGSLKGGGIEPGERS